LGTLSVNEMADAFSGTLKELMDGCFRWVKNRKKSNEKPWITAHVKNMIKKRQDIFREEGRSAHWKRLDKSIKETISLRRKRYLTEMRDSLCKNGNGSRWYGIYKNLDNSGEKFNIMDLEPNLTPREMASKLAKHFTSITNIGKELEDSDIPGSNIRREGVQLTEEEVLKRLKSYKKPKSTVDGDLPPRLVNSFAELLSGPLTQIYNACLWTKSWPDSWKMEWVTPIPKTITPSGLDDVRPISMTTLWSKILETFISDITLDEIGSNLKPNQHGGKKGSSTNHVLVNVWDQILRGLDKPGENKAVVITCIDFSKSFSRCSHQEILRSYAGLGASDWVIAMHAAFLKGRKMRVKIGVEYSDEIRVTGGAVQGSILGVMDHNVCLENLDDGLGDKDLLVEKYVDDMTIIETVTADIPCVIDVSGNRPLHSFRPMKTQAVFDEIVERAESRGLKINDKKTQMLSISSARFDTEAWIRSKRGSAIKSSDSLKLLGFIFGNKPTVQYHVNHLVRKFAARSCVLHRFAREKFPQQDLIRIYTSLLRTLLEYSAVLLHSQMTQTDANRLERLQQRALKGIFGYDKIGQAKRNELAGIPSLADRREVLIRQFAQKSAENPNYSPWFPERDGINLSRHNNPYKMEFARGNRLQNSPIFVMRAILNDIQDPINIDPLDLGHLFQ